MLLRSSFLKTYKGYEQSTAFDSPDLEPPNLANDSFWTGRRQQSTVLHAKSVWGTGPYRNCEYTVTVAPTHVIDIPG